MATPASVAEIRSGAGEAPAAPSALVLRAPSADELLGVWEAGYALAPVHRALALLAAACPELSPEALAALSIGQRDGNLLELRQALWGPQMEAVVACPRCRDRLELPLDTREMLAGSSAPPPSVISLSIAEFHMTFRLPSSLDVIAAARQGGSEAFRLTVLARCLVSAAQAGVPVAAAQLPSEVVAGIAESMSQADPLANIQMHLTCPACAHRWHTVFDIVSFLWTEIEVWAWRILSDVHTLARAYGWSERDILRLSPTRRQFYLEMVGA